MSEERLQKLLARVSSLSRRAADALISEGRVTVNGRTATPGEHVDPDRDAIKVDGKRWALREAAHRYLLVHKPPGVMSTRDDPEGRPTVMDLLPVRFRELLVPVGRLDFDTEGLLLMTNDGELAQRVAHPRYGCTKTYHVKIKGKPEPAKLDRLRNGVRIDGRATAPARIEERPRPPGPRAGTTSSWWTVELNEGRTRQIREMFRRIGHPVARLRRVAIGPLRLRGIALGSWRELAEPEVEQLRIATTPAGRRIKAPAKKAWRPGGRDQAGAGDAPAGKGPKRAPSAGPKGRRPSAGAPDRPAGGRKRPSRSAGSEPAGRAPSGRGPSGRGKSGGGPGSGGPSGRGKSRTGPSSGGPSRRGPAGRGGAGGRGAAGGPKKPRGGRGRR